MMMTRSKTGGCCTAPLGFACWVVGPKYKKSRNGGLMLTYHGRITKKNLKQIQVLIFAMTGSGYTFVTYGSPSPTTT